MNTDAIRTFIQTEILNDPSFEIAVDQDLLLSQTLDSLGVTRLVQHIETQSGVEIPPEDVTLENFQSLQAIEAYLTARNG